MPKKSKSNRVDLGQMTWVALINYSEAVYAELRTLPSVSLSKPNGSIQIEEIRRIESEMEKRMADYEEHVNASRTDYSAADPADRADFEEDYRAMLHVHRDAENVFNAYKDIVKARVAHDYEHPYVKKALKAARAADESHERAVDILDRAAPDYASKKMKADLHTARETSAKQSESTGVGQEADSSSSEIAHKTAR
jgi:hypothetical protein